MTNKIQFFGLFICTQSALFPFFGTFPTDRIPTMTNDNNVHFFIHIFTKYPSYSNQFKL